MSPTETVRLANTGRGIVHLDPDCQRIRNGSREVSVEFARRAEYRTCRVCGDGGPV